MTEMLNKEFSRKSFVKGGGAMIVGFSVVGAGLGAKAAKGAVDPYASMGPFDQTAVDSWLIIHADNTASVKLGKVEMGQGTPTALLMIAAEELDMGLAQMKMINHDTNVTPNQGGSTGSQGVQTGGKQTRAAAAAAKAALLKLASTNLGVPVGEPHRRQGRRLGRRQDRHLRRADRRQALQHDDHRLLGRGQRDHAGAGRRGLAGHEARQPVQARRHQPAAHRHPGEGHRRLHLRPQHPGPGHAPRPRRAAARAGRLRRRHRAGGALGRRELDQAHRRARRSCASGTSSASSRRPSTRRSRRPRS